MNEHYENYEMDEMEIDLIDFLFYLLRRWKSLVAMILLGAILGSAFNKGYTQFRQINILYQNEEYALVEQGTSYGLTVYDHIVLNGSAVDEDQIIY